MTSASSFGRLITTSTSDRRRARTSRRSAERNNIVTRDVPPDPAQTQLIAKYNDAVRADREPRRRLDHGGHHARAPIAAGESALGDVIADAQLASTSPADFGGAVVAFMNPGGIRGDLTFANSPGGEAPGQTTYRELFDVQPFNNVMTVKTMTGDMIYRLLAQQFNQPSPGALRILQVSKGFTYSYTYNDATQTGTITPGSVKIDGVAVQPAQTYRVAMNNFLASGGDGFTVFNEGTDQLGGEIDLDALVNYFMDNSPIAPGPQDRITRLP